MPRPSTIDRLPPSLKAEVDRLVRRGGHTIDEIVDHLRTLDPEEAPSRSAVGRYKQRMDAQLARFRAAQEVAGRWVADISQDPDSDVGRLLAQVLQGMAFQTMSGMDGEDAPEPDDLAKLARMLKDLAAAEKTAVDRAAKIRTQVAAENLKKLDQLAKGGPGAGGPPIDLATLDEVRRALGTG